MPLALVLFATFATCTKTERPAGDVILHPAAATLLSSNGDLVSVPQTDPVWVAALPFAAVGERAERVFGRETGSEWDAYGEMVSAAILPTGRVVRLDATYGLVSVLEAGNLVAVGGLRQGPGEFVEPITLFSHLDSLFVFDQ